MAKAKRQWQAREQRLVSEYLAEHYGRYETMTRVRLGSINPALHPEKLTTAELRAVGVWRRWADAIVVMPDKLVLIEAKIRPNPGVISQLELYEHLVPLTPELKEHKAKRIEKVLLLCINDPVVVSMAREKGIKVVHYKPDWVDEYLDILYPRERRAPLS